MPMVTRYIQGILRLINSDTSLALALSAWIIDIPLYVIVYFSFPAPLCLKLRSILTISMPLLGGQGSCPPENRPEIESANIFYYMINVAS